MRDVVWVLGRKINFNFSLTKRKTCCIFAPRFGRNKEKSNRRTFGFEFIKFFERYRVRNNKPPKKIILWDAGSNKHFTMESLILAQDER